MNIKISEKWKSILNNEFQKNYFKDLINFIDNSYSNSIVFPNKNDVFNVFSKCSFDDIKVVIIGQDPYHGKGQANGLAFSVNEGVKQPPSLRNIIKEVNDTVYVNKGKSVNTNFNSADISRWPKQGVFLLNSSLTVEESKAGSHANIGWEVFTDKVISILSKSKSNLVFLLWGKFAEKKKLLIDNTKHLVLVSAHPSPLSAYRGFFGSNHFNKANDYLEENNKIKIDW